jgi:Zn-dependent protease
MTIDIVYLVVVFLVILISMTLHEAMHGYVAYWLGDDTAKLQGRLTLNPLAHIDPFLTLLLPLGLALAGLPVFGGAKPVPFNPGRVRYGELGAALVGIAGPLTNFILAFVLFVIYVFSGAPALNTLGGLILQLGVSINLGFFVFNMLPIPPLDGSRVLYALAPDWARRGMEWIERYGVVLVFIIVLLASSLIGQYMNAAIGFFIGIFERLLGV